MSSSESDLSNPKNYGFDSFNVSDAEAEQFAVEMGSFEGIADLRNAVKNLGIGYTSQDGEKRFQRYATGSMGDNSEAVQALATKYMDWADKRTTNEKGRKAAWEEYRKNVMDRPGREQTILQPLTPAQGQNILGATVPEPVTILGALNNTRMGR